MSFARTAVVRQTRIVSLEISIYVALPVAIKELLLGLGTALAFPSTIPYNAKSRGLQSGEEGGQKLFGQKC